MSRPYLSIIVVSYNTRELTLECLRSIFRETKATSFEVILIDNASDDESVEAVCREFGELVSVVASKDNLGFAAANNYAAKQASGDFLLLLNPDTVVLDQGIDRLVEFSRQRPDAGIWGGKTVYADGRLNPSSCWSKQTVWSLLCQAVGLTVLFRKTTIFNPEAIGGWDRQGTREVDIVSGCFLLISRELWQALNGFREAFFMYGEEADLCLRAKRIGASPCVTSSATIIHHGGASEVVQADKLVRLLKAKVLLIQYHFKRVRKLGVGLLALWPMTRCWGHGLLASLGRRSSAEKFQVWKEVVNRYREWVVVNYS